MKNWFKSSMKYRHNILNEGKIEFKFHYLV